MTNLFKLLFVGLFAAILASCANTRNTGGGSDGGDVVDAGGGDTQTVTVDETDTGADDRGSVDVYDGLTTVFYFDFDKSSLDAKTKRGLDAYAAAWKESPKNVRVEGHADERGTREYNIALGERRAKAVASYLINKGVRSTSIETISYGEERPESTGSNESSWAKNRRAELK